MNLRVRALALATGCVLGIAIFTLTMLYLSLDYQSETLIKLRKVLFGYSVTFMGGIIGLFWGFLYGAIGGGLMAVLYNKFAGMFSSD